mgnify:CR=1 FL=1
MAAKHARHAGPGGQYPQHAHLPAAWSGGVQCRAARAGEAAGDSGPRIRRPTAPRILGQYQSHRSDAQTLGRLRCNPAMSGARMVLGRPVEMGVDRRADGRVVAQVDLDHAQVHAGFQEMDG